MSARHGQVTAAGISSRMQTRTDLIASQRSEAARSDSQVGIILAGTVAAVGFIATAWTPRTLPTAAAALWWIGMTAAVTGIAALGVSLCPSIPTATGEPAGAWHCWHVRRAAATGTLTAVLDRTPTAIAAADDQVAGLATVVAAKWRWNRAGLRLLGLALAVLTVTGIAGQVT